MSDIEYTAAQTFARHYASLLLLVAVRIPILLVSLVPLLGLATLTTEVIRRASHPEASIHRNDIYNQYILRTAGLLSAFHITMLALLSDVDSNPFPNRLLGQLRSIFAVAMSLFMLGSVVWLGCKALDWIRFGTSSGGHRESYIVVDMEKRELGRKLMIRKG